jgi:hypothetical protein
MLLWVAAPGRAAAQLDMQTVTAVSNTITAAWRRRLPARSQTKGSNNSAAPAGDPERSMASVVCPAPATDAGIKTHLYPCGSPLTQRKFVVPLHPPTAPTAKVTCVLEAFAALLAKACNVKSGSD